MKHSQNNLVEAVPSAGATVHETHITSPLHHAICMYLLFGLMYFFLHSMSQEMTHMHVHAR